MRQQHFKNVRHTDEFLDDGAGDLVVSHAEAAEEVEGHLQVIADLRKHLGVSGGDNHTPYVGRNPTPSGPIPRLGWEREEGKGVRDPSGRAGEGVPDPPCRPLPSLP